MDEAPAMPAPILVAPVTTTPPQPRWATVTVCGSPVQVEEPVWCTGCEGDAVVCLEDLQHSGEELSLSLPGSNGAETAVTVQLICWPFSEKPAERTPYVSLQATSGDCTPLTASLAESVAAGLERHAAMLRALTGQLAGV
jgi:hypothetical protein